MALPANTQAAVDRAHATARKIVQGTHAIRTAWVLLGGYLCEFVEERMWEPLGLETLEEWLASPEVELSRTDVFRVVRVYRGLVLERGVSPEELHGLSAGKLDVLLPALKAGRIDTDEALSQARALTRRDLVAEHGGGPGPEDRVSCPTCGSRVARERVAV